MKMLYGKKGLPGQKGRGTVISMQRKAGGIMRRVEKGKYQAL